MKVKNAIEITGSFSKPSKMPGWSYGLPAWECKTGSKLRKIKNSVCATCYALKGNYTRFPEIKKSQYKRLDAIKHPQWVRAMATIINTKKSNYFRWHDAGDVQSLKHLAKIFKVCRLTPSVKHWMPTREAWIQKYVSRAPNNLVIRFSMPMVDMEPAGSWPNTSTVVTSGRTCPAPDQGNACGDCRACWDPAIKNIAYGKH